MRLIDADALRNVFDAMHAIPGGSHFDHLVLLGIKKHIDDTPTIDAVPVVHGRWLPGVPITCSLCGKPAAGHGSTTEFWLSPYCPWCGQPMDAKDMDVPTMDGGAPDGSD